MSAAFFIDVVVRARGAGQQIGEVDKKLNRLDLTAGRVARNMARMFRGFATAFVVTEILSIIDTYTTLNNKVRVVTDSQDEANAVLGEVFSVANRARVPVEAVARTYSRLRQATEEMGLSQRQSLRMVETLSKGIQVNGASAQEAASTMRQFVQALSKGKLNGDEFVSVLENSPAVTKLITKELKVTKGELFALAKQGKITGKVLVDALQKGASEIDREFAKMTPTIGNALTVLRTNFVKFIGELATTSGVARGITQAILYVSDNFETFMNVVLAASNALTVVFAGKAVTAAVSGLRLLGAAALANPFTALVLAVVFLISLLVRFDASVTAVGAGSVKLARVVEIAWGKIKTVISDVLDALGRLTKEAIDSIYEGFKDLDIGLGDTLVFVGIFIDKFVAGFQFLGHTIKFIIGGIVAGLTIVLVGGFGAVLKGIEEAVNAATDAYNSLVEDIPGIGGKLTIGSDLDLGGDKLLSIAGDAVDASRSLQEDLQTSYANLTSKDLGPVARTIRDSIEEAARGTVTTKKGLIDLDKTGKNTFKDIPGKDKKDEFKKLAASLFDVTEAAHKLAEAQRVVNAELAKGTNSRITSSDALELMDRQKFLLQSSLNPLGAYKKEVAEAQAKADAMLRLQDQAPAIFAAEASARDKLNAEIQRGNLLSDYELEQRQARGEDITANIQRRNRLLETYRDLAEAQEEASLREREAADRNARLTERIENAIPANERYAKMLQEISEQFAAGHLNAQQFDSAVKELDREFDLVADRKPLVDDSSIEKIRSMQAEMKELVSETRLVAEVFSALEDQIVSFVTTGDASFKAFVDSLLESLTRLILKLIETRIMMAILGGSSSSAGYVVDATANGDLLKPIGLAEGGHFRVGGEPGRDKNLVPLALSQGEDLTVRTPAQRRAAERGGDEAPPRLTVNVINMNDPSQVVPVMGSRSGRRQVYNSMRYAPRAIERMR
jgi:tape measure domain-containing protein